MTATASLWIGQAKSTWLAPLDAGNARPTRFRLCKFWAVQITCPHVHLLDRHCYTALAVNAADRNNEWKIAARGAGRNLHIHL